MKGEQKETLNGAIDDRNLSWLGLAESDNREKHTGPTRSPILLSWIRLRGVQPLYI